MSILGWLITWSVQCIKDGFLEFPDPWIFFLTYMLALSHWNLCFCSHECSAILDLPTFPFVVFRLCSFTLACKGLHHFLHLHGMLWMQFFDSCVWFGGLVFVSMLRSVLLDLKAVLMPCLLSILLNFSDIPCAYGIIAVPMGFSCAVWLSVFLCFFVSMLCGYPLAVNVDAICW